MLKIMIDAGHGHGREHNRGGLYFNEGDNNFLFSLVLKEELEKYNDVFVSLTRNKITDNPSLSDRANMGKGYDLFLSEHSNADANPNVRGSEVWDSVEKRQFALAKSICDATSLLFNHRNRGVKYREGQSGNNWYRVLRSNGAKSAMIIENGFHTNHHDCLFFKENHKSIAMVRAMVIAEHYGLSRRSVDMKELEKWQKDLGKESIDNLLKKSLVNNPDDWKKTLGDNVPQWLLWVMIDRITNHKGGEV